jgi:HAD superfamily hydrolase (TIGR01490 family)
MTLALFDLDNTLLDGDSDYLWGQFLVEREIVDRKFHESENKRFYAQYLEGSLNIHEFLTFQLQPLAAHPWQQLVKWRDDFLNEKIAPVMLDKAHVLLKKHRDQGHLLMIITATNRFITEPIAQRFGVEHLLATEPEMRDGEYTGAVSGTPCFQQGKVELLQQWLTHHQETLKDSWFYSDSHNDLPLLNQVDHPFAVDPDDKLRQEALSCDWPIISLRN